MKKILPVIALICLCSMNSCHARQTSPTSEPAADSIEVRMLTKADFIKLVFDFEKDSTWNYLGTKPAIIDFYADWCQPCRTIAPILKDLAETYRNQIVLYKVNVDQEEELAALFRITSIPMVLLVPMEGTPNMIRGAVPRNVFEQAIKDVLLKQ